MKDKIKAFLLDPFNWYVMAAVLAIICTGLWMLKGETMLAIVWAIISGGDIASAYLSWKRRK